jgi:hypothetical protein
VHGIYGHGADFIFSMMLFLTQSYLNFLNRNFETVKLQYRHFDMTCVSDDPQKVPFIKVNLTDRKGWQNRMASSQGGHIQGENYL